MAELEFLGTGASGGTPGEGRSRRRESSARLDTGRFALQLDLSRDLEEQIAGRELPGAVALTHAHRDASGGVPALGRLMRERGADGPVTVHASRATIEVVRDRYARLGHLALVAVEAGEQRDLDGATIRPVEVPHARSERFLTYAWRVDSTDGAVVYASDVAELTDGLRDLASGADVLVIDGAMYGRSIFSHLRIDRAVPELCRWDVARILLTQIGRTAPRHDELAAVTADLCSRAAPAFDGMRVVLGA